MKYILIFIISFLFLPHVDAQKDTLFINKIGKQCNREEAEKYSITSPTASGFISKEYDISGVLREERNLSSIAPKEVRDGLTIRYLKTGEKIQEIIFLNGMRNGTERYFFPTGRVSSEGEYRNDTPIGEHSWYTPSGSIKRKEFYESGKMVQGKCYTPSGADTTYFPAEEMPEFPGKEQALYKFISDNVKYPKECRKKGIEGRVYIKFKVSSTGEITEMTVIKGVHPLIDEEAMRVVGLLPKWKPGRQEGKPVSVMYTLPIKFSLK
jgi:TonB family protein